MVGSGGIDQIVGTYFQQHIGTRFQFVPYRGGGPSFRTSWRACRYEIGCGANAGRRSAAVSSRPMQSFLDRRWFAAPDVPTSGIGLRELTVPFWMGLWAPKGTPRDIVAKLNAAVLAAQSDAATRQRLLDQGVEPPPRELQTPEAFGAFHKAEVEKWWPFIKAAGIKAE